MFYWEGPLLEQGLPSGAKFAEWVHLLELRGTLLQTFVQMVELWCWRPKMRKWKKLFYKPDSQLLWKYHLVRTVRGLMMFGPLYKTTSMRPKPRLQRLYQGPFIDHTKRLWALPWSCGPRSKDDGGPYGTLATSTQ